MVLDNSEQYHFRHTDYYALACSYLSMAILNQVDAKELKMEKIV